MAYIKRKIKNGKIQINGMTLRAIDWDNNTLPDRDVWIRAWRRTNGRQSGTCVEELVLEKTAYGELALGDAVECRIPLYASGTEADGWYAGPPLQIGQGRIETIRSRPTPRYQMRFTRKQWEAIEWAIDCGISAAKTQFSDDEETVALAPVLQSVLDEINGRA